MPETPIEGPGDPLADVIEAAAMNEADAIAAQVERQKAEAVAAAVAVKESEIAELKQQAEQARKDGVAIAFATIKRRLGMA
jgi:hypothetical protein